MLGLVRVDTTLLPFLLATDEEEAQRLLAKLVSDHVEPVVGRILNQALRLHFGGNRVASQNQDAEDIRGDILIQLFKRLRDFRAKPQHKEITDFRGYVAVTTYNTCYQHLRQKYPNRWRLKNKLRYLLTHHQDFALWESDGNEWLCGIESWRGSNISSTYQRLLDQLDESPRDFFRAELANEDFRRANPADLLAALFKRTGQPLVFDDLVNVLRIVGEDKDHFNVSLDDDANQLSESLTDSFLSLDEVIDQRLSLQRLWTEVCQLPRRQRVALLLNLRDEQGRGIIALIPFTRTATIRQIAEVLDIPLEGFAEIWNRLPLDDETIAGLLGATRQQVINLRKSARERLARRMKAVEKGTDNRPAR